MFLRKKLLHFFSIGFLLVQSFSLGALLAGSNQGFVLAQEALTPTESITVTVSPTSAVTPTDVQSPSPTATPTSTPTPPPSPTAQPTLEPSATSAPSATIAPTEAVSPTSTSAPSATLAPSATSAPTSTPAVLSASTEGAVTTQVIETTACFANSLNGCIITDKNAYSSTEVVLITGYGFTPNTDYRLVITADNLNVSYDIKTDANGSFSYSYQLDGTFRPLYNVYIKDLSGNVLATTTFTDPAPPSVDFKQCANENPTAGACDWIGSILIANNSAYFEGMSVPQRLLYRGIGNGAHTISFKYSYTKGGIHAYDFITGKNQGNGSFSPGITTFNDCQGLSGPDLTACNALVILTENFVSIPNDSFDSKDSAPAPGTGSSQTAKETAYGARSISVYNTGTISATSIGAITHNVAANGDTGDSDAQVTFNFTLASCPSGACNLVLYFDGHLAVSGSDNTTGVNWGPGLGSANINGGPYHIKDINLDNSGGSLDNQIQGASILVPQGTIELKKHWVGTAGSTTLNIGTSNGGSQIDTQAVSGADDTTGQNTVDTGTYFNSETGGLANYDTAALSCFNDANNNGTNDSEASVTVGANDSVVVGNGQHVICTYTNTRQQGKIQLTKDFVGTPEDVTIKIGTSGGGSQVESKALSADGTTSEHTVDTDTYFVSETLTTPANYDTLLECFNDIDDSDTINGGDTSHSVNTGTGAVSVGNNDDVICRYTNTRHTGTVELKKHWVGTAGSTSLTIGSTIGGSEIDTQAVSGSDGTTGANTVDTGTYYGNETGGLTNYDSSALSCFNDANNNGTNDSEASVTVGANNAVAVTTGQHVICTFTNTRQQGKIELQKDFVGTPENVIIKIGTSQNGTQVDTDVLSADGTDGEHTVDTGTYFVSEVLTNPANYTSGLVCSNDVNHNNIVDGGDTVHAVNTSTGEVSVGNGDDVICVYTNTRKQGTIELKKAWSGTAGQTTLNIGTSNGGTQVDTQLTGADGAAPLTTGQNTVDTGTYFNSETGGLTNYTASALVCFNDANNNGTNDSEATVTVGANDSVSVGSGQHVICTYTNTRNTGTIVIIKNSHGGPDAFDFNISGPTASTPTINTVGSPNGTGTTGNITVDTGAYTVNEGTPPIHWTLTDAICNAGSGTDTNADGILDTWNFSVTNGGTVTCTFTNSKGGTTRTQGFWATHTTLANNVWGTVSAANASLCTNPITATVGTGTNQLNQLMGGFWANIANKISPKATRTDLDKARMQMLQQYLAAVLNFYEFGSGSPTLFSTARTAYCATNVGAIKTQTGILGAFNESGDSGVFTPGSSATPSLSKTQADILFWNTTTH